MVDMSAIAGMLSSLQATKNITEAMIGLANAESIRGKILEIQSRMLDAQSFAFQAQQERTSLVESIRELEDKISALIDWKAEKERYHLKPIGDSGVLAYSLKTGMEAGDPPHYICPTCYNQGNKSILQPELRFPGRSTVYACHNCKTDLYTQGGVDPRHRR